MSAPTLILVSGPPASGKTTVSRLLSREFGLPLVGKDAIKERLYDTLGAGDRPWAQRLGRASIALLWDFVEAHLQVGQSVIAESNFHATGDTERLTELRRRCAFTPVQIHCTAPLPVLWGRFEARDRSGDRHPCHLFGLRREELEENARQGLWDPLTITGRTLTLDTADWSALDLAPVRASVRVALGLEPEA